ncbi:hypothetical protein ACFQ2Y_51050 [Streptomyces malaysiensis subsp. malaysiensis]
MVDPSTATPDDVDTELAEAGYTVLRNRYELSNARNGYAQSWGKPIKTRPDTNMDRMAREILDVVAR